MPRSIAYGLLVAVVPPVGLVVSALVLLVQGAGVRWWVESDSGDVDVARVVLMLTAMGVSAILGFAVFLVHRRTGLLRPLGATLVLVALCMIGGGLVTSRGSRDVVAQLFHGERPADFSLAVDWLDRSDWVVMLGWALFLSGWLLLTVLLVRRVAFRVGNTGVSA